jgi:hypothetical protein
MATRSTIALDLDKNHVKVIYCHFDGYPEHHLPILTEHYNTVEKINELLDLGDLSVLNITPDTCIAYGRDRYEKGTEARKLNKAIEYTQNFEDYNYLFKNGVWTYTED